MEDLRKSFDKIPKVFRSWGRNAKVMAVTHPFWGIPLNWGFFYRPIFLSQAVGLSEIQIGLLTSVLTFFSIVGPLGGGYLADRFGRKRTFILFDNLGWISSLAVWIVTRSIWFALVAYILEGLVSIVFSVWECILVEDTESRYRASVYAFIAATGFLGALSTPIAGYIIGLYGIDVGSRIIFFIAFISMIPFFALRQKYLKETELKNKIVEDKSFGGFKGYLDSISMIKKNRILTVLLSTYFIGNFYNAVAIYLPLYLVDRRGLGLREESASLVPTAYSASALIISLLMVPRLTERSGYIKALVSGYGTCSLAMLFLAGSPKGSLATALLSGSLLGVFLATSFSISRTFLANEVEAIDSRAMAKILSVTITLSSILNLPTPILAGALYSLDPRLPFIFLSGTLIIGLTTLLLTFGQHRIRMKFSNNLHKRFENIYTRQ